MHHLLRHQEQFMHEKTASLLHDQSEKYTRLMNEEVNKLRAQMEIFHNEQLNNFKVISHNESLKRMHNYEAGARSNFRAALREYTNGASARWKYVYIVHSMHYMMLITILCIHMCVIYDRALIHQLHSDSDKKAYLSRKSRLDLLRNMDAENIAIQPVLQSIADYQQDSAKVHKLEAAVNLLSSVTYTNKPFVDELETLRAASRGDEFLQSILLSLPSRVSNGVRNTTQLKHAFEQAADDVRISSRTPQGGTAGYLFVSKLITYMSP